MTKQKKLPIIGMTTYGRNQAGDFYLPGNYLDAVRKAGGCPLLLTPGETHIAEIIDSVDGLIFSGGGDINPALYGGVSHPKIARVDRERDDFEMALAREVLKLEKPVLGICRGSQLLNVASGGNLVEHLPDDFGTDILHVAANGDASQHPVSIDSDSRLAEIFGATELTVASKHHQCNRVVSRDWRIVATASDGVIEAMEHQIHPWLFAVLWHPEILLDEPVNQRIFRAFVTQTLGV